MAVADGALADAFGGPIRDMRIWVTGRCQFRCTFCMPREVFGRDYAFLPRGHLLTFEELTRVTRIFADLGVRKLRLTGGEPLLRRDLDQLVAMLAGIAGIGDIALTTNGALLASKATALAAAGLRRGTARPAPPHDARFAAPHDPPVPAPSCRGRPRAGASADGRRHPCLFAATGHDLRGPLRAGASDQALRELISAIWTRRADRYSEQRTSQTRPTQPPKPKVEMSRIGG